MKTITMYELLGKVKDGNIPKRIIYDEYVYQWNNIIKNYERESDINVTLNWDYIAIECLNEKVEILEEEPYVEICGRWFTKSEYNEFVKDEKEKEIPEKIKDKYCSQISKVELAQKYNEIIDYLDYLKSKGE